MTVPHGKSTRTYVEGYDLSAKLDSVIPQADVSEHETTVFGLDSRRWLSGLISARLMCDGVWDTDLSNDNLTDDILSAQLAAGDSVWCVMVSAAAIGDDGFGVQALHNKYEQKSKVDDATRVSAEAVSQTGFDAIKVLHVKAARTTNGNGLSADNTVATDNGGVGYIQIFDATGGNAITVLIEHSENDFDWATLISFTAATAIGAERKTVTGDVYRYLRASWTHASPPGSATFFVAFGRK